MNFEKFMEEWKPFPKDKVNRQIDKKEKSDDAEQRRQGHVMKGVKNFKTKMTDPHKAGQKMTGSDRHKQKEVFDKHNAERDKAIGKMNKLRDKAYDKDNKPKIKEGGKKYKKIEGKWNKALSKAQRSAKRRDGGQAVNNAWHNAAPSDDKKQAEVNKKSKEDRAKAKRMMDVTKLEKARKKPAVKGGTKGGFGNKKESMDFTEFLSSTRHPLYEKEGDLPKCPPGYKYDKEMKMCVPKSPKDAVGNSQKYGDKDMKPGNGAGYNTWGASGYSGTGYAWEEQPTSNDAYNGGD